MKIRIVPIGRQEAQDYVEVYHRHLGKSIRSVFELGIADDDDKVRGVVIVGYPIARFQDNGWTLEVNRCCTDGVKNGNSMLYGAAWRVTRNLGYTRLITYTHQRESGVSLRASGWTISGIVKGETWDRKKRPHIDTGSVDNDKYRWEITTPDNPPKEVKRKEMLTLEKPKEPTTQLTLFN